MPRTPRLQVAGGVYHVIGRGVARQPLFRDDSDRALFLRLTSDVVRRHEWSCHAFCLMTTHYHLLVRTPKADLARGMQRLNGCYAQNFNRRHGESGHRLERRYQSVLVTTDRHVIELIRYFAMNPVRAGVCRSPEEWAWGSYAAAIGAVPEPPFLAVDWLLTYFSGDRNRARERLRSFVMDASDPPKL